MSEEANEYPIPEWLLEATAGMEPHAVQQLAAVAAQAQEIVDEQIEKGQPPEFPLDVEHETTLCLDEAKRVVMGDRARDYGKPSVNHKRTAMMWSAYLGIPISARQVCVLNILQKLSRDAHRPKTDNMVDVAGYAQNAAWVADA